MHHKRKRQLIICNCKIHDIETERSRYRKICDHCRTKYSKFVGGRGFVCLTGYRRRERRKIIKISCNKNMGGF